MELKAAAKKGVERKNTMRLKYRYEIMEVEGQSFAVPVEDCKQDFGGMIKLSRTAGVIFELLQQETDEEDIVESMAQRFDASRDTLAADVHGVVEKLRKKGLLIE